MAGSIDIEEPFGLEDPRIDPIRLRPPTCFHQAGSFTGSIQFFFNASRQRDGQPVFDALAAALVLRFARSSASAMVRPSQAEMGVLTGMSRFIMPQKQFQSDCRYQMAAGHRAQSVSKSAPSAFKLGHVDKG
ncbi:MAG TPA: hypothetical protein VFT56_06280 [Sphingomonas sp.]|nr:hypothetical protein [Sphingomonas sp.]